VYDRLLAAGAVGTKAIALLALIGFIFDRPDMFVDLAITYALLNFIGTLAAAKYIENHAQVPIPSADSGQPLTFPLEGEERQRTEKQEGGRTP
jgi:hypothetical protein